MPHGAATERREPFDSVRTTQHLAGGVLNGSKVGIWQVADFGHEYRTPRSRPVGVLEKLYTAGIAISSKHRLLAAAVGDGIQLSDPANGDDLAFIKMLPQTQHVTFDPRGALLTNSAEERLTAGRDQ